LKKITLNIWYLQGARQ